MPPRNSASWAARAAIVTLASLAVSAVHAQVLGDLKGRVADAFGAAVANATVALIDTRTGIRQTVTTTSTGAYDFPNLVSSTYGLSVDGIGFKHTEQTGITVTTGQTVGLDVTLQAGGSSESVAVTADALSSRCR